MIRIAIVEDEEKISEELKSYVTRFFLENKQECRVSVFSNALSFVNQYHADFDLIFMDINLPVLDGMTAIKKIRERDEKVLVIFVTSLAQYAIKGYEVNAFDFMVKPVSYQIMYIKLMRVLEHFHKNEDASIVIRTKTLTKKIAASKIKYIEIVNHSLIYHTVEGNYVATGTLKKVKEELKDLPFEYCNQCYLVNLKYVEEVKDYIVKVAGENVQISHPKHKDFLHALNQYLRVSSGESK